MYSAELLHYFAHPRNPGQVDRPDASATLENPACGDILELSLKISGGRILEARFRAKGCVPSMACGAALTELIEGRTIEQARRLGREEIIKAVGGLPQTSIHASHLAVDVLRAALQGRGSESGK